MKQGKLLLTLSIVASLACHAQNNEPVAEPGAATLTVTADKTSTDSYVIGASDVLVVTVWKQPTLSGSLLVRPDGMISMPLLGDVQASGATPLQLGDQIAAKLKRYLQDPTVSVVLSQINSKKVFLLGEVEKRGPVDLASGMNVLQAIASAGGLTNYANPRKIYILRHEDGTQRKISVHYKEALKGESEFNLALQSGDTIVVP
jgi:polysaccharide export outer membrane protein